MNEQNAKQEPPKGTPCLICGKPVLDYVATYCCGGQDCGCLGLPLEPCACSRECEEAIYKHDGTMEDRRIKTGIAKYAPASTPADAPTDATGEAGEGMAEAMERGRRAGVATSVIAEYCEHVTKLERTIATLRDECAGLREDLKVMEFKASQLTTCVRLSAAHIDNPPNKAATATTSRIIRHCLKNHAVEDFRNLAASRGTEGQG